MDNYFKNTELAVRYNISEATVRNWIKSTKDGKTRLELLERGGRTYVANSISNIAIIESLIKQNRKYRNTLAAKIIAPSPEFFEVFNEAQIYDIVRSMELHHEIPRQYGYFRSGVEEWASYIKQRLETNMPSVLSRTLELLADNYSYIDRRLAGFKKVNVIDIGPGDATPVEGLIAHLIKQNKLGRYVALDFSEDMLDLAKRNMQERFGDCVEFEGYQLDISYERFSSIIAEDYFHSERNSVNLALFLGSTPNNLRTPGDAFRTICESMNLEDLFIYTGKLAPKDALPEWFEHEFKRTSLEKPEVTRQQRLVLDLLNIKDSFYDIEISFDEKLGLRYARAKFKVAIRIIFDFGQGQRTLSFEKGDSIILWRAWQTTRHNLACTLENNGFYLLHSSQSEDHNYILTIAEVQKD